MYESTAEYYEFREFRLDVSRRQLLKDGHALPLSQKAFQILLLLVRRHGEVLAKDAIIEEIWPESFVEDSNLTQHIYVLRKTLENGSPAEDPIIRTVPKHGYIFTAEVNAGVDERNDTGQASAREAVESPARRRVYRPILAASIVVFIALAVIAGMRYRSGTPLGARHVGSIAVLPFKAVAGGENGKLGFGMADAVITKLSKLHSVQVRPTSSVFRYVDQNAVDVETVGRGLSVDAVLEGTLQTDGDRIRVSVQLVDVRENRPLWAERFDEKASDIFSMQDAIAGRVAMSLNENLATVPPATQPAGSSTSPEAYEKYSLGLYHYNKRSKEELAKAEGYLVDAIRLDPNFASSHAVLADVYNMQVYYGFATDREERVDKAGNEAQTALRLDEELPEAHIAMAQYVTRRKSGMGEPGERSRHLERAIELAPSNSTARLRYGWLLFEREDTAGAESQILLARENDPLSALTNGASCDVLMMNKKFAEALPYCEKSFELEPALPQARLRIADAYAKLDQVDKAIEIVKADMAANGETLNDRSVLAYYYARTGNSDEARRMLDELVPQVEKEPGMAANFSLAFLALNEPQKATHWYRTAWEKNSGARGRLRYDPDFDPIREYPSKTPPVG